VAGNGSRALVVFHEWWNGIQPRAISALGGVITVIGEGFAGAATDYVCEFSQTNSLGEVNISINATSASLNAITCPLEAGFGNMQAGFMRVALVKEAHYVYGPPVTYSYTAGPPVAISALDAAVAVSEVITGSSPGFGSAFGNESFFIFGYGFLVPAGKGRTIESLTGSRCTLAPAPFNWTCDEACHDLCSRGCLARLALEDEVRDCLLNCSGAREHEYALVFGDWLGAERSTLPAEPYAATFGGVLAPCCEVLNVTLIVCTSPEWLYEAATIDVMLWHRLPTPPVALVSAYETLVETPLDKRSCSVTDPLVRCTVAADCNTHLGALGSTCLKDSADSMYGVCMAHGRCYTHEHCPGDTRCSELCKCVRAKVCPLSSSWPLFHATWLHLVHAL